MTVTATTEDGDKIEVPLEWRLGGWWPPVPPFVWTEVAPLTDAPARQQ